MNLKEIVIPNTMALIVIDMQNDFCSNEGIYKRYSEDFMLIQKTIPNVQNLTNTAKDFGILTVFVRSLFDNKYKLPHLIEKHRALGINEEIWKEGSWGTELYIAPSKSDPIITKHNEDAFLYTFLDPLLKKHNVKTVVLAGLLTEKCIETTARSAQLRGYFVIVPEDCIGSDKKLCHEGLVNTMRNMFMHITDSEELVRLW